MMSSSSDNEQQFDHKGLRRLLHLCRQFWAPLPIFWGTDTQPAYEGGSY